jgi:hypothetical protein
VRKAEPYLLFRIEGASLCALCLWVRGPFIIWRGLVLSADLVGLLFILDCLVRKSILQAEQRGILYVYSLSIHMSRH